MNRTGTAIGIGKAMSTLTTQTLLVILSLLAVQGAFASSASAVAAPADFYGFNTAGQLQNTWEAGQAEALGIHNVRIDFVWRQAQTASCDGNIEAGPLNVSVFDNQVRSAAKHNVTIIANLYQSRAACNPQRFPNPGTTMYGAWKLENQNGFLWALVQRYGFSGTFWTEPANAEVPYHPIRIWEVWNEENLPGNNPGESIQPQKYAQLLVDSANTIRRAQEQKSGQSVEATDTKVVMGGLVRGGVVPFNAAMTVTNYLNSIYSSPSGYTPTQFHNAFDGLSYHPYALTGNAGNAEQGINDARGALDQSRSALGGGSDSGKTLWITELGWPVMNLSSTPNDFLQAQVLAESFAWIYQQADAKKIKYAAWFVNQDYASSCESWTCWAALAGLRRADGSERPSRCAYADLIQVHFCNPYPTSWANENLGGLIFGDQTISAPEKGKLNVFAWGAGNQLWHKWMDPAIGGWSGWYQMIPPKGHGNVASGPDSASWAPNRVDVVARVEDGTVEHWYWDGSEWYVDNLSGGTKFDPTVSAPEAGKLNVFAVGGDNQLWHKWYDPAIGGWSAWYQMSLVTHGALTSGPDSVSWAPNRVDVVARAGDGTIEHWYWNGSTWGLDNLGGSNTVGAPAITSWESGRLDVFENISNSPYRKSWIPGVGWTTWEPMYGLINSGIDATSWGKGRIDLVAQAYFGNNSVMWAHTGE